MEGLPNRGVAMNKLVITVTCDSTMSYPRNPYNPQGVQALADDYVRSYPGRGFHLPPPRPVHTRREDPPRRNQAVRSRPGLVGCA